MVVASAQNEVTLEFVQKTVLHICGSGITSVVITDSKGEPVKTLEFDTQNQVGIDFSLMDKGTYFVSISGLFGSHTKILPYLN